jgi:hypothetical protein
MKKVFLTIAFGATLLTSGLFAQEAAAAYAAIAFSPSDGSHGRSHGFGNRAQAERAAMNFCRNAGGGNCRIVNWSQNSCAALAVGRNNGWGAFGGASRAVAERRALANCNEQTSGCQIRAWTCSGT